MRNKAKPRTPEDVKVPGRMNVKGNTEIVLRGVSTRSRIGEQSQL